MLSKEISELIAAGEVIERPASVIKELLENSIDSGANIITVEIKNGGISYIRITDNGCGISENDVPLAFLRHATSKIAEKSDLDSILTLGFRGEALASISAVSKVDVITKKLDEEYGTHYKIKGSEEKLLEKTGCPEGTTVVIRDIFYNIPARLKFMKKAVTEGNAIASVLNKLALSHPEISFKFIRDNKQELLTAGDGKLYSAIYTIFGRDFAKSLIPVDYNFNNIIVKGFVVKPLLARSNRSFQNFFINNRYVKSITCTVSLEEAYRNLIMTGKFPACVLNIEIPPNIVDVNVHPAKIEVRFSDEKLIFDSVYFAVKNALLQNDTPTELKIAENKNFSKKELFDVKPIEEPPKQFQFSSQNLNLQSKITEYLPNNKSKVFANNLNANNIINENFEEIVQPKKEIIPDISKEFKYINKNSLEKKEIKQPVKNDFEEEKQVPKIRIIGEAFLTYIIAEVNDELLLVDKHAAHERYIFEKIKANHSSLETQLLLEPIEIMLSLEEFDAINSNLDKILELGFLIKAKKLPEVVILGTPAILNDIDINDLIPELAENFIQHKNDPMLNIIDEIYHSMACKLAIKANDKTSLTELKSLLEQIYDKENIRYCPHGRPVMIKLSKKEIEKQFKRIL